MIIAGRLRSCVRQGMHLRRKISCRYLALIVAAGASAATAEPSFVPVYRDNFPDPFVLLNGSEFIAYATNDGINLPMLVSRDLVNWARVTDSAGRRIDGMPVLAQWVKEGRT